MQRKVHLAFPNLHLGCCPRCSLSITGRTSLVLSPTPRILLRSRPARAPLVASVVWPFPTGQPGASCFGAGEVIKWFNPVLTCQVLQARWGSRVPHVKEGEGRSGFEEGLFKQPLASLLRAVSFMPLKSSLLLPARIGPTPFPLCQLLVLSPFIHFTFLEVYRAHG